MPKPRRLRIGSGYAGGRYKTVGAPTVLNIYITDKYSNKRDFVAKREWQAKSES